jgi:hypothetical protein
VVVTTPSSAEPARLESPQPDETAELPLKPASLERRVGAGALDLLLLVAVAAVIMDLGLGYGRPTEAAWFELAFFGLAPLYFALYHAFGTGATPGQLELRIGIRDERTGGLIGPGRAVLRAYGGLIGAFLFFIPSFPFRRSDEISPGRSILDRLTGSTAVGIALHGKAPELAAPTVSELRMLFEPAEPKPANHLRRGSALVAANRRPLLGCVAAFYAGLLAIVALLAGLLLADYSTSEFGTASAIGWIQIAVVLLVSGVYWTQVVVVHAVEAVRVGSGESVGEILRRSLRRINALSAALLVIVAGCLFAGSLLFALPVVIVFAFRFAFVAPALALEDTRVFGSFARSWQLTEGRWREAVGLTLRSLAVLCVAGAIAIGLAAFAVNEALSTHNVGAIILAAVGGFAVACIPVVLALTVVGAAWSLLYEDLRRELPPGQRKRAH